MIRIRLPYVAAAALLLAIEIAIALFIKGGFVRHTLGDFLVVILLYAALRGVFPVGARAAAALTFAFACLIEAAQAAGLFACVSSPAARIALGATFAWTDIAAYAAGAAFALLADPGGLRRRRR